MLHLTRAGTKKTVQELSANFIFQEEDSTIVAFAFIPRYQSILQTQKLNKFSIKLPRNGSGITSLSFLPDVLQLQIM